MTITQTSQPPKGKIENMWDSEPRAGKSSDKWVKSHEMPQISYRKDFQWGLWVIGSHTSLQSCSSKHHNQFYNLGFVISMVAILKQEKQ